MISRSLTGAAVLALFVFAGPDSWIDPAKSLTIPNYCGGVEPCPPACFGAPEEERTPAEFVQRAAFELGSPTFAGLPPANLSMPPLVDPKNVYSETGEGKLSPATAKVSGSITSTLPVQRFGT